MLDLSYFIDFYKNVAKDALDETGKYEDLHCEHLVNYASDYKTHQFAVKQDDMELLFISATVHKSAPHSVFKWQIRAVLEGQPNVDLDSANTDDDTCLTVLLYRKYSQENLKNEINNSIRTCINKMMFSGMRF